MIGLAEDFNYKAGETYKYEGGIKVCEEGFHFCKKLIDCFGYYRFDPKNKVAEVEALGLVETRENKSVTDEIRIVRELSWYEVLNIVNQGDSNTGFDNNGHYNTGNRNNGNYNSGGWNNGNGNIGHSNIGNGNSGDNNKGSRNTGYKNIGYGNSGDYNSGNCNTRNFNTGEGNSGFGNNGHYNTGDGNNGNYNSGNYNNGNYNSGYWNKGDYNTGIFNTTTATTATAKMCLFNKPSEWTMEDWMNSEVYEILSYNSNLAKWISEENMTDEEKEENPNYRISEGYLKVFTYEEMCKNMWNSLTNREKEVIKALPNFDKDIFEEITGIKL